MSPIPLLLLVGPTGIGKTAVAIELCALLEAEVISADSMQIYRGCDIVTAKPSPAERQRAPHHLIDIREPTQTYSAATWAHDATTVIEDIIARGKRPLIVGGTGFYIRALLEPDTLAAVPPSPALRAYLESELAGHDAPWLHDYLASLDPLAAQRLHPNDTRRVIRAIEVAIGSQAHSSNPTCQLPCQATEATATTNDPVGCPGPPAWTGERGLEPPQGVRGTPWVGPLLPATLVAEAEVAERDKTMQSNPTPTTIYAPITFGLDMERAHLYERLEQRIDAMLQAGALEELRALLLQGVSLESPIMQGLGYRQLLPALSDPTLLDECVALWKRDTRRYAKRQLTWFRHQLPVQWIILQADSAPIEVARQIAQLLA